MRIEENTAAMEVVTAGLVWIMIDRTASALPDDPVLTGPAIGAALGAASAGGRPRLLAAVPDRLPESAWRIVRSVDPEGGLLRRRSGPPLVWRAGAVIGETRDWKLEGDPRGWTAACAPALLRGRALALANGNPGPYAELLKRAEPRFIAIDVNVDWLPAQAPALKYCLQRAQLVTVTREDYLRLPSDLLAGTGLGRRGGPALVVKAGEAGVTVHAEGQSRWLQPPKIDGGARTDVGAGDLLLGILTARLGCKSGPVSVRDLEAAYAAALTLLARLLESESFTHFAEALPVNVDAA